MLSRETRKSNSDFKVMLIHHVVTLSLVISGYLARHFNHGLVVAYLHDVTDIFLEFSKLLNYTVGDPWSVFTFFQFMVAFFVTRIVVYPIYIILPMLNRIGETEIYKTFNGNYNP